MIVTTRTEDRDLVKEIMTHEDIWWRISEAEDDIEAFYPPEDCIYILATIDGMPAGLMAILPDMDSHFQLLPEFRDQKYQVGQAVLKKAKDFADRLTATISKEHPNVHHFALKNGYNLLKQDSDNWFYEKIL